MTDSQTPTQQLASEAAAKLAELAWLALPDAIRDRP